MQKLIEKITKKSDYELSINELLFFVPYGLIVISNILMISFYGKYLDGFLFDFISYFCIGLLFIKEVLNHSISFKELVIAFVMIFFYCLIKDGKYLGFNRESTILLLIYCSRNIDVKKNIRTSIIITAIPLILVVLSSQFGIIQDIYEANRNRHYLGFLFTLYGPAFMFNITYSFFLLKKKNNKYETIKYLALLCLNILFYIMTNSRLSFVLSSSLCVVGLLSDLFAERINLKKIISYLFVFSFLIAFSVSIVAIINYDQENPFHSRINSILSNRLYLGKNSMQKYGVSLYPRQIKWHGQSVDFVGNSITQWDDYDYVDNAYQRDLQKYGIIFTTATGILITVSMNELRKRKKYRWLIAFSFLAIQLMIDDLFLLIQFNSMFLVLGCEMSHYLLEEKNK